MNMFTTLFCFLRTLYVAIFEYLIENIIILHPPDLPCAQGMEERVVWGGVCVRTCVHVTVRAHSWACMRNIVVWCGGKVCGRGDFLYVCLCVCGACVAQN